MKHLILFAFLIIGLSSVAQTSGEWDEWQRTSCYSKISFRLKEEPRQGEQHHWKVQFRSDYNELISFNYNVTDKLQQHSATTHRKTLQANEVSGEVDIYAKEADIYLLVDKVALSPYPENFIKCD
ncbi:MAG: hypothetical protein EOO45_08500 [Flavobacterium sp.]|nr:MAG: hypothetical protein EOO45_08500 [Flavobacterium sp.]